MTRNQWVAKRSFDVFFAIVGLLFLGWLILFLAVIAAINTARSGFFFHARIGKDGKMFRLIKIRTMRDLSNFRTTVTTSSDPRITGMGRIIRRWKLDELPQLWNVLVGDMSFVGPRPDVGALADSLEGSDKIILSVRPGITSPATLKYRNEELLLAKAEDPKKYNNEVIWPDKVRLNREYVENYSLLRDIRVILQTISGK